MIVTRGKPEYWEKNLSQCHFVYHKFLMDWSFIEWRRIGCPKRSLLKNWKGRDEEEDPGKGGEKKWKEIFKCWE